MKYSSAKEEFQPIVTGSADRTILDILSKWDEFGKTNWIEEIDYPELTLQQTQYLLTQP